MDFELARNMILNTSLNSLSYSSHNKEESPKSIMMMNDVKRFESKDISEQSFNVELRSVTA